MALLAFGPAQADYRFESNPLIGPFPPWTDTDRVVGRIELDGPLTPWTAGVDLRSRITELAFDDGVHVFTFDDTQICRFEVTVDANGAIMDWVIDLRQNPPPTPGDSRHWLRMEPDWVDIYTFDSDDTTCNPPWSVGSWEFTDGSTSSGGNGSPGTPVIYRYDSAAFSTASDPFSVGESFTAQIQFAGPIPPSLTDFDLAPFVATAAVHPAANPERENIFACWFRVDTDESGQIIAWNGLLSERVWVPPIGIPGPESSARGWGLDPQGDYAQWGVGSACDSQPRAMAASGGTWRGGAVVSVPVLNGWALLLLIVLLGGIGLRSSIRAGSL